MYSVHRPRWGLYLAILLVFIGLAGGAYWGYHTWQARQAASVEIRLETPPALAGSLATSQEYEETVSHLADALAQQEELRQQLLTLQTTLKEVEPFKQQLQHSQAGREVLQDFASRFFKYEPLLGGESFFSFFQKRVTHYLQNRDIRVKGMLTSDENFRKMQAEFVQWWVQQDHQKLQALAEFVGRTTIEHLYQLPFTLFCSALSSEIEVIDFNTPVVMEGLQTPPLRDANGELKMPQKAYLDQYTSAQQFFYRRGPQFSQATLTFLKAYLAYEGQ